jgi:oligopeptide/dipeptide ABC transporter ATP-binding protein
VGRETGMGVLLITHDLGVVAETCDRVVVLYSGRVMESTDAKTLFAKPAHPYTQGLLASLPESVPEGAARLNYIAGQPPANPGRVTGCPFRSRCPKAMPGVCEQPLPTVELAPGHTVRCHLYMLPSSTQL